MGDLALPDETLRAVESLKAVDIVVGIPSYNNARTIGHVVSAASLGLAKYFGNYTSLIVNSDGGSTDNTREAVLSTRVEDSRLMLLSTPMAAVNRLSLPYHGIPGKGSSFRLIFQLAQRLGAKACAVVDSDLRSITPEWIDLLLAPVLSAGQDLVTPYYQRHKYDGTITNGIVYPLTRALYGLRVRQPIGGEFGLSARLIGRYLERDDWETDVARFGIDIWMTTIAIAEGFHVVQSFLGAKLHDAKDPGTDLSAMLKQVVGSVYSLMREYEPVWRGRSGSQETPIYGFKFDVGVEPIAVNVDRMIGSFRLGCDQLKELWQVALPADTLARIRAQGELSRTSPSKFHLDDELWARIVLDFAIAYSHSPLPASQLMSSFTPLYLGRVASFVLETEPLDARQVEEKIERLCQTFEELKPYLIERWAAAATAKAGSRNVSPSKSRKQADEAKLEV
jgi:glycosyltransferase involved in cell wall biosynthesis